MVKNVVNSIVVEPKQKRGRKPKNAALLTTENKVLEEAPEKDNKNKDERLIRINSKII